MGKKEFEIIFSSVLAIIIKIEDKDTASKAISRLIDMGAYFDLGNFMVDYEKVLKNRVLDIEVLREKKHKKWSLEKLMRFFLVQCWNENKYKTGLQWYYITGLVFEFKNQKIDTIATKRDIKFCRNLIVDMHYLINETLDFSLLGTFGEWWNQPLYNRIIKPQNNDEIKKAIDTLRNMSANGQKVKRLFKGGLVKFDDVKYLRDGEWLHALLNSQEETFSDLVDIIINGNNCNGVIAAVILDKVSMSSWKSIPLSTIAIPLLDSHHKNWTKNRNWMSGKFKISPKGDKGDWGWWIIMGHGNRLEPLLCQRIKDKISQQIFPPYELSFLSSLFAFHDNLSPKTYEFLYTIINDIIKRPDYYEGWFEFGYLKDVFRECNSKNRPSNWDQLCVLTLSKEK